MLPGLWPRSLTTPSSPSPLLIIALAIAGQVFDQEAARQHLINQIVGLGGSGGQPLGEAIETILDNVSTLHGNEK